MKSFQNFFDGKKTYTIGLAGVVVVAGVIFGYVDVETANILMGLLGFSGLITLRKGVSKIGN